MKFMDTSLELQANKYLSDIRLYRFKEMASNNDLLTLYMVNIELSMKTLGLIGLVEVILRNKVNKILSSDLGSDYLEGKHGFFTEKEKSTIGRLRKKIQNLSLNIKSSRLLSKLTFGFWCGLFQNNKLWCQSLSKVFPKNMRQEQQITFRKINATLKKLYALRNKIAHHERLLKKIDLQNNVFLPLRNLLDWLIDEEDKQFKTYILEHLEINIKELEKLHVKTV